jgi:hypothetical protein
MTRDIGVPRPGFWKIRLVRGGPHVPAKIWDEAERDPETGELLEDEKLRCVVNGIERDPEQWAERLNCYGIAIDEDEYQYMSRVSDWAKEWAPDAPEASPTQPIDPLKTRPVF